MHGKLANDSVLQNLRCHETLPNVEVEFMRKWKRKVSVATREIFGDSHLAAHFLCHGATLKGGQPSIIVNERPYMVRIVMEWILGQSSNKLWVQSPQFLARCCQPIMAQCLQWNSDEQVSFWISCASLQWVSISSMPAQWTPAVCQLFVHQSHGMRAALSLDRWWMSRREYLCTAGGSTWLPKGTCCMLWAPSSSQNSNQSRQRVMADCFSFTLTKPLLEVRRQCKRDKNPPAKTWPDNRKSLQRSAALSCTMKVINYADELGSQLC